MNRKERRAAAAKGDEKKPPHPYKAMFEALGWELVLGTKPRPYAYARCYMRKGQEAEMSALLSVTSLPPTSMTPDAFGGAEFFWEFGDMPPRGLLVHQGRTISDKPPEFLSVASP